MTNAMNTANDVNTPYASECIASNQLKYPTVNNHTDVTNINGIALMNTKSKKRLVIVCIFFYFKVCE